MKNPASSRLPTAIRPGLLRYCDNVKDAVGDRFVSLTVFGAVLTSDWGKPHPIHHAIVLTMYDLDAIGTLSHLGKSAAKLRLSAPLLLTPELVQSTLDTFPLEWLDINACHEVLAGADIFQGLVCNKEHVRLQCERECSVLAMSLRQRLVSGKKAIAIPLHDLAEHATRILRGFLYLSDGVTASAPSALLEAAAARIGADFTPVRRAWAGETGLDLIKSLHGLLVELAKHLNRA